MQDRHRRGVSSEVDVALVAGDHGATCVPSPRPRADARPAGHATGRVCRRVQPHQRTLRGPARSRRPGRLGPGQPRADVVGRVRERMTDHRRPDRCREASAATPPAPWSRWSAARPPDRDRRRRAAESAPRRQPSGGQEFRASAGSRDRSTPPSAPPAHVRGGINRSLWTGRIPSGCLQATSAYGSSRSHGNVGSRLETGRSVA